MAKLFHLSCFLPANALHDAMRYLETRKAYNLEIKTLAADAKTNGAGEPNPNKAKRYDPTNRHIAMQLLKERGGMTVRDFSAHLKSMGRSASNASTCLRNMEEKKLAKRDSKGIFKLTPAGAEKLQTQTKGD